jgi:hypothetical protein
MRRFDYRIVLGLILLLGGGLLLLQTMGFLENASAFFLGSVFIIGGAVFLSLLFGGHWWGAFPGMTLLSLGLVVLFEERLADMVGLVLLGGIAIAFWLVYLMDQAKWWALIPAGVLSTLAIVTIVPERAGVLGAGSVLFLGLAFTFLLVALVTGLRWAYYPAAALGVMGILAAFSFLDYANYVWAATLIAFGGYLLFRSFTKR